MSVLVLWILFPVWISTCENIALGKNAKQSSVYQNRDASNAVNGILISSTNLESQPWWAVDLGAIYKVTNVVARVITGDFGSIDIDVLMPSGCSRDKWATFQRGEANRCQSLFYKYSYYLNATSSYNIVGRFVRIKARSVNYLNVFGVEVFGVLHQNQAMFTNDNVYKACGYSGMGYNGSVIETTHARSNILCISKCSMTQRCSAAEFIKSNNQCILFSKDNDNEETTHSMYSDSKRHVFLL